jgi:hypothetical protein
MARRLPRGLLNPSTPGGPPRSAGDVEYRIARVERSVPELAEEIASDTTPPRPVRAARIRLRKTARVVAGRKGGKVVKARRIKRRRKTALVKRRSR